VVAIQVFTAHRAGRVTTWEPLLTLDKAYRATLHFIHQYYQREPIDPFLLMLVSRPLCRARLLHHAPNVTEAEAEELPVCYTYVP
jgi:hypothetical protein